MTTTRTAAQTHSWPGDYRANGASVRVRRCWTRMGARSGCTASRAQRTQILTAAHAMTWTYPGAANTDALGHTIGPAARAILGAVLCAHHDRPGSAVRIGSARLDNQRLLIGLDDTHGLRVFLLDLGAEAVCVLAEFESPRRPAPRRHHGPGSGSRA